MIYVSHGLNFTGSIELISRHQHKSSLFKTHIVGVRVGLGAEALRVGCGQLHASQDWPHAPNHKQSESKNHKAEKHRICKTEICYKNGAPRQKRCISANCAMLTQRGSNSKGTFVVGKTPYDASFSGRVLPRTKEWINEG